MAGVFGLCLSGSCPWLKIARFVVMPLRRALLPWAVSQRATLVTGPVDDASKVTDIKIVTMALRVSLFTTRGLHSLRVASPLAQEVLGGGTNRAMSRRELWLSRHDKTMLHTQCTAL